MEKITWSYWTDTETLEMLKELAEADDRKRSPYLTRLIRKAYEEFKAQK